MLPAIPAPPTFAAALRPNDVREGLGLDFAKLLHGEESYELARPLYAGDRLTLVATVCQMACKVQSSAWVRRFAIGSFG